MKSKLIQVYVSHQLLAQLDKQAKASFSTRSNYIRECIAMRLRGHEAIKQEHDEFMQRLRKISGQD